jgi:hypothetical protein
MVKNADSDSGSQEFKNQRVVRGSVRTGDVGRASLPVFSVSSDTGGTPVPPLGSDGASPYREALPYLFKFLAS